MHLTTLLHTQITFIDTDKYYERSYVRYVKDCYCKYEVIDSSYIHGKDTSGNFMLYALDTWSNLKKFDTHKDNRYFLWSFAVYNDKSIPTEDDKLYEDQINTIAKNSPYLDTVYVNSPDNSYRTIKIILVTDPVNFPNYKHVFIDYKIINNLNKKQLRPVLCPDKIDNTLIAELNARLIDLGFLSKATRTKYLPEIRDALIEFQKANHLPWGFVDQQTLDNLDINLIVRKH